MTTRLYEVGITMSCKTTLNIPSHYSYLKLAKLPVYVVLLEILGNLRTTTTAWSTTTGSELHCTAQARLVNFVVVVSSTTPKKEESRRPAIHKLRQV